MLRRLTLATIATGLAAVALVIVAGVGLPSRTDYANLGFIDQIPIAPEVDALAPPFTLNTLRGNPVNLTDLQGQIVIINFWATWCVPCLTEMPELQAIHEDYSDNGVYLIAVNLGESRSTVQSWVDDFGFTFTVALDTERQVEQRYQLRGQPTTVIIAPDGTIKHIEYGATTYTRLAQLIENLNKITVTTET